MKTTISLVVLFASATFARPQPGLPFLLIWPSARSTALAGAMTGLADDPDAAFFNPAGLAFQSGVGATADYGPWLPGVYPGMWQGYVAGRFALPVRLDRRIAIGIDATELNLSDLGVSYIDPGWPPPRVQIWRVCAGAAVALRPIRDLGVGLKLKYVRSSLACYSEGYGRWPDLGARDGGTGSTWACDVAALWRPSTCVSLGGSLDNLGPGISYPDVDEHDPSPMMLRLGACWTPLNIRFAQVNVLPEIDKSLVGVWSDSAGNNNLRHEFHDAWKALAVEVTAFRLVAVRLGYFEDRTGHRGGLRYGNEGMSYRYSVFDLMTGRHLGELESIGLCWGFGIGYKDYFRIDVSSDAAIYDFPTKNWKLSLVANDIAGGIRELRQGHAPWEE
jgi:hypothetical protein